MLDLLVGGSVGLLHNLRHHEQAVRFGRRVAQRLLVGQAGTDFIGPRDVDERDGARGGFDLADIELLQFFDVAQNVAELRAEFLLLLRRERDARKVRHVFNINFGRGHGERLRRNS